MRRTVTIFDVDLAPGVAFLRSLSRAGAPVRVCTSESGAPGRHSRFASGVEGCPSVRDTDEFVGWLADEITRGRVDLIAPTSDYVMFSVAAAAEKVGVDAAVVGHPSPENVLSCLFKDRFHTAMGVVGFPTPPSGTPTCTAEALAVAGKVGYPVVLKPRSHAGVGRRRGIVVRGDGELEEVFGPFPLKGAQTTVLAHDADLAYPILQHYLELGTIDVVSVSGFLTRDGSLAALHHSRKVAQSPRRLGVGTMFEPLRHSMPFTDHAVDAVRQVLGSGVFELEVAVDKESGAYAALDLNPRGFGQMSLDIALGNDLPVLWYNDVSGARLPTAGRRRRPPHFWHDAVGSYVGFATRFARGPGRSQIVQHAWKRLLAPSVGAMHEWSDPSPGLRFGLRHLRHPRAFLRPFLFDTETVVRSARALDDDGEQHTMAV